MVDGKVTGSKAARPSDTRTVWCRDLLECSHHLPPVGRSSIWSRECASGPSGGGSRNDPKANYGFALPCDALGQHHPLRPVFQTEIAVDKRRGHGALSNGGCDALYGAVPKVSGDEYAWLA
jgi:hypothetical protein